MKRRPSGSAGRWHHWRCRPRPRCSKPNRSMTHTTSQISQQNQICYVDYNAPMQWVSSYRVTSQFSFLSFLSFPPFPLVAPIIWIVILFFEALARDWLVESNSMIGNDKRMSFGGHRKLSGVSFRLVFCQLSSTLWILRTATETNLIEAMNTLIKNCLLYFFFIYFISFDHHLFSLSLSKKGKEMIFLPRSKILLPHPPPPTV